MCYIFESGLQKHQSQAVVSSPVRTSVLAVQQWLRDHDAGPGTIRFSPPIVGRELVDFANQIDSSHMFEPGKLAQDIDWPIGIEITSINFIYGILPFEDGYVAIVNADFVYTSTESAEPPTWAVVRNLTAVSQK